MGRESSEALEEAALSFLSAIDTESHQIVATKVNSRAFLVVIAPKRVSRAIVRKTMRELIAHLAAAPSKSARSELAETARHRVNVRPPP